MEQSSAVDVSLVWILKEGTPVVRGASDPKETTGAKNMNPPTTRKRQHSTAALFAFLTNSLSAAMFVQAEQSPHRHPESQYGHPHLDGGFWNITAFSPPLE